MSFWDKVKDFVGVEEDYIEDDFYDDYDDDRYLDKQENYDDIEDEKTVYQANSYGNEVRKDDTQVIDSVEDNYARNYKPENSFKNDYKKEESKSFDSNNRREERSFNRNTSYSTMKESNNTKMHVTIREPLSYEDGKLVLDDIMQGRSVVLNLEMLEVEKKTQIFYFVSGGLYSLNGTIQNVTKDIYVLAPQGIEIDSETKEDLAGKNLYQI